VENHGCPGAPSRHQRPARVKRLVPGTFRRWDLLLLLGAETVAMGIYHTHVDGMGLARAEGIWKGDDMNLQLEAKRVIR
jgi:hypothetical protein